jgi:hypothetical protein
MVATLGANVQIALDFSSVQNLLTTITLAPYPFRNIMTAGVIALRKNFLKPAHEIPLFHHPELPGCCIGSSNQPTQQRHMTEHLSTSHSFCLLKTGRTRGIVR